MRYHPVSDAEWVQPRRKGYYMKCCDCGLVHKLNFRLVPRGRGKKIQFQAFRIPMSKKTRQSLVSGVKSLPAVRMAQKGATDGR